MEYFILGMLTVQFIFPLLEGITNVILAGLEVLRGRFGLKVTSYSVKMRELTTEENDAPTRQIGFTYDQEEEEDDE